MEAEANERLTRHSNVNDLYIPHVKIRITHQPRTHFSARDLQNGTGTYKMEQVALPCYLIIINSIDDVSFSILLLLQCILLIVFVKARPY